MNKYKIIICLTSGEYFSKIKQMNKDDFNDICNNALKSKSISIDQNESTYIINTNMVKFIKIDKIEE